MYIGSIISIQASERGQSGWDRNSIIGFCIRGNGMSLHRRMCVHLRSICEVSFLFGVFSVLFSLLLADSWIIDRLSFLAKHTAADALHSVSRIITWVDLSVRLLSFFPLLYFSCCLSSLLSLWDPTHFCNDEGDIFTCWVRFLSLLSSCV